MDQAADFLAETQALAGLLAPLPDSAFDEATQFKGWTVGDVIRHLHFWNRASGLQLTDEAELVRLLGAIAGAGGMRAVERATVPESGQALRAAWLKTAGEIADIYATADPKARLKWAGPDMSARSSITARLMETWAHGQEVYDHLGVERADHDRIKNIAHLGVSTFGWTYQVRRMELPPAAPFVRLTAPSGAVWTWGEASAANSVAGSATEFCQVVTQVRNVADTKLVVRGPVATQWMGMAQCFAGAAEPPPAPGSRFRKARAA
ncbi:MAG: TIGR03084 family protein [Hyphomonadaceae bacterium]|jgi:uncharacterized protein (TIGR03084 family)|nr:TIGR03084 family protein [Hyphomonadaceae bacterium]